jgi:hypothetical protein
VGGGDARLHAVDRDGKSRWVFSASDWVESPAIRTGRQHLFSARGTNASTR